MKFSLTSGIRIGHGPLGPLQSLGKIHLVLRAEVRRLVPVLPGEARPRAQVAAHVVHPELVDVVDRDGEGNLQVLPLEGRRDLVHLARRELVSQPLVVVALGGLRRDAQRVFGRVVPVAAPGVGILGEDDGPLILPRDEVQAVAPRRKRPALDLHLVRGREGRVLVGAAAPGTLLAAVQAQVRQPPGDELSPDLPPAVVRAAHDARARVLDRHAHGADRLRDRSLRVVAVGREGQALRAGEGMAGSEEEWGEHCQKDDESRNAASGSKLLHFRPPVDRLGDGFRRIREAAAEVSGRARPRRRGWPRRPRAACDNPREGALT